MKTYSRNKVYGRKIVEAAISGISKSETPAENKSPLRLILGCLTGAAIGTCADKYVLRRPARFSRTVACAAVGLLATLAWNTRNITGAMVRSAAKEIGKVRDAHWLETNPIDYA
jgi:hypothetical protein